MIELYSLLHNWFYNVTFNEHGWGFWHFGEQSFLIPLLCVFLFLSASFYYEGWPSDDDEWWYIWLFSIGIGVVTSLFFPIVLVFFVISIFSWKFFPWIADAGERKRAKEAKKKAEKEKLEKEVEEILNIKE